jgi:cytochrome c551/c552
VRPPTGGAALLVLILALAASPATAVSGPALDYTLECAGCHRGDGTGTPGSVPALRDSVARFLAVPGGRDYLARVPGAAQAPLDDAALAAVLNWMLDHFDAAHVPAGFAPYTATEVGPLRAHPLVDVEGTRKQLLDRMTPATPGQ